MALFTTNPTDAKTTVPGKTVLPDGVVIETRHLKPDRELWARATLNVLFDRLQVAVPHTDRPGKLVQYLQIALQSANALGTVYVNPMFTVTADKPSATFYKAKARCQQTWLKWVKSWLTPKWLRKNMRGDEPQWRDLPGYVRRLARNYWRKLLYTGVLIVEGKHVPKDATPQTRARQEVEGKQFGRLSATVVLNRGRCLCHCTCGRRVVIRISNLLNRHTSSCGCLRKELDERLQAKKEERALRKSAGPQVLRDMMEKVKRREDRRLGRDKRKARRVTRANYKAGINSSDRPESKHEQQSANTRGGFRPSVSLPSSEDPYRTQPAELAGPGGTTTLAASERVRKVEKETESESGKETKKSERGTSDQEIRAWEGTEVTTKEGEETGDRCWPWPRFPRGGSSQGQ